MNDLDRIKKDIEQHKRLQEFKEDLDRRLQEHLDKKFREEQPEPKKKKFGLQSVTKVDVLESIINKGTWSVFVEGVRITSFNGPNAHRDATRYAGDILNGV